MTSQTRDGAPNNDSASHNIIIVNDTKRKPVSLAWLVMPMPRSNNSIGLFQFKGNNA